MGTEQSKPRTRTNSILQKRTKPPPRPTISPAERTPNKMQSPRRPLIEELGGNKNNKRGNSKRGEGTTRRRNTQDKGCRDLATGEVISDPPLASEIIRKRRGPATSAEEQPRGSAQLKGCKRDHVGTKNLPSHENKVRRTEGARELCGAATAGRWF